MSTDTRYNRLPRVTLKRLQPHIYAEVCNDVLCLGCVLWLYGVLIRSMPCESCSALFPNFFNKSGKGGGGRYGVLGSFGNIIETFI